MGNLKTISVARLSIAAIITYQALLVALILLRPDLDPSWHTISEWAIGKHGWIMTIAFFISAISYVFLFVAIKPEIKGKIGKVGLILFFICIVGTFGVGIFTTDPMEMIANPTTRGRLHIIFGSSALFLLPFAALLLSYSLAMKNDAWAPAKHLLLLTG